LGTAAIPRRLDPCQPQKTVCTAAITVSAFVDPAQGIGGLYGVRYELVTAGASAYPGRTRRQMAPGN